MAGLDPAIHVFAANRKDVDARQGRAWRQLADRIRRDDG
jgi:hypothetical protein